MAARIYADFMKGTDGYVILTCYGTLRDLSRHRIKLEEGMSLTFYADSDEAEDLEVEGVVYYETGLPGRPAHWSARYDPEAMRDVPVDRSQEDHTTHPCFNCRRDLSPYFAAHGRSEATRCPDCGTSIMEPMLPPPDNNGGRGSSGAV